MCRVRILENSLAGEPSHKKIVIMKNLFIVNCLHKVSNCDFIYPLVYKLFAGNILSELQTLLETVNKNGST